MALLSLIATGITAARGAATLGRGVSRLFRGNQSVTAPASRTLVSTSGFNVAPASSQIPMQGSTFAPGANIEIIPDSRFELDPLTGEVTKKKRRKRRRRMLTCADRSDIAFITATLGKGASGQAAIAGLIAKCS